MGLPNREYLEANGIRVLLMNLAGNKKGFSVPNGDGFLVVINSNLGPQERLDTLDHELEHIRRGDHFNPDYVEYAY